MLSLRLAISLRPGAISSFVICFALLTPSGQPPAGYLSSFGCHSSLFFMRVIAGSAGGIPLQLPRHDLRPTMDKVKAAIFSSLADRIPGAKVLDLFAGSGGLGLEALSRGCSEAVFVDSHAQAIAIIQANFQKTRLSGQIERAEVFTWLKRNAGARQFDLIFADPPYAKSPGDTDFARQLVESADLRTALAPDGLFILEKAPQKPAWTDAGLFTIVRQKQYGAAHVLFLKPAPE
jgi:16S rRNA (guanine966-N2)-methyltransferase